MVTTCTQTQCSAYDVALSDVIGYALKKWNLVLLVLLFLALLKGHTVSGMAGQECGLFKSAGPMEWHHTCVRIYRRSVADTHIHTLSSR